MYSYLFKNPKAALLFVVMTVFSAVSMIGTADKQGMLTETVDRLEEHSASFAGTQQPGASEESTSELAASAEPVFGEYGEPAAAGPVAPVVPEAVAPGTVIGGALKAPIASTAIIVRSGPRPVMPEPMMAQPEAAATE